MPESTATACGARFCPMPFNVAGSIAPPAPSPCPLRPKWATALAVDVTVNGADLGPGAAGANWIWSWQSVVVSGFNVQFGAPASEKSWNEAGRVKLLDA